MSAPSSWAARAVGGGYRRARRQCRTRRRDSALDLRRVGPHNEGNGHVNIGSVGPSALDSDSASGHSPRHTSDGWGNTAVAFQAAFGEEAGPPRATPPWGTQPWAARDGGSIMN